MLTRDESELYDRQIRLWGVNAQSRIRKSRVLMLGFNGVASEVAKILVLAGVDTLTIVDDQPLQDTDLTSNLFCRPDRSTDQEPQKYRTHAVQPKLKTLNPLVNVNIDNSPILSKKADDFKKYDLVTLHSFMTIDEISSINDLCRTCEVKFYLVLDYGFFGFMFNDLGPQFKFTHEEFNKVVKSEIKQDGGEQNPISVVEDNDEGNDIGYVTPDDENSRPKKRRRVLSPNREPAAKVEGEKSTEVGLLQYATFSDMISLKHTTFNKLSSPALLTSIALIKYYDLHRNLPTESDKDELVKIFESTKSSIADFPDCVLKRLDDSWFDYIYGSLSPVCTIIGGAAGQDMIRALSCRDIPICNTFSFDGINMNGTCEKLGIPTCDFPGFTPVVRDILEISDDDE